MAFHTDHLSAPMSRDGLVARFLRRLSEGFEAQAATLSRRDRIEALEAMSDAELARMGLRRDQIAYHVFHDLFYA